MNEVYGEVQDSQDGSIPNPEAWGDVHEKPWHCGLGRS